jgi:small subunit ribosomal protein S11
MKKNEKKVKKNVKEAIITVFSSFNNTIITAADKAGNTLAWASAGSAGFKGARQSTPFAAQAATEELMKKLKPMGVTSVSVSMNGIGNGRESVLKGMHDFHVTEIRECTPIPHNGCKLPKRRKS